MNSRTNIQLSSAFCGFTLPGVLALVVALTSPVCGSPDQRDPARLAPANSPADSGRPTAAPENAANAAPLNLAGKLDLASLLDLASATSGIGIDYDPDMLKGQSLTLRAGQPVGPDQLWGLIHRALAQRNLTLVCPPQTIAAAPAGGKAGLPALSLCRTDDAMKQARTEPVIDLAAPSPTAAPLTRAAMVIQPVRLAHITAADALRTLKARARVNAAQAGDDARMITLTDQTARVAEALAVLREADTPAAAISIEPFAPVHQSAADVLAKVAQLRGGAAARASTDAAGATPPGDVSLAPGNTSLLIVAPRAEQPAWRALLSKLDAPEVLTTITYTPRGTSSADTAALLARSLGLAIADTHTPTASPDQPTPTIRPDTATGSVTLTATARQHAAAKALLDSLTDDPAIARPTPTACASGFGQRRWLATSFQWPRERFRWSRE